MTTNALVPLASFTLRTFACGEYFDQPVSVFTLNGRRLMALTGDDLVSLDSFLESYGLGQFRHRPQLLDGSEVRLTNRRRQGQRVVSILGGPLHGRQF